jgi:hypothetical protein
MDRFVMQTTFGGPDGPEDEIGDCWAACVATMLGCDISIVPEALRLEKDDDLRWVAYQKFLAGFNLRPLSWNFDAYTEDMMAQFWKAMGDVLIHVGGKSPRGDWDHAVVYQKGKLFHDPHPSGDGVKGVKTIEFWLPIDPMKTPMGVGHENR